MALVNYFKKDLEAAIVRLEAAERMNRQLKVEQARMNRQYEELERWAVAQEARADALHEVIHGFIDNSTTNVRRDLLEEFNRVAEELDVDLDLWDQETLQSEESLAEDISGLDEFFNY